MSSRAPRLLLHSDRDRTLLGTPTSSASLAKRDRSPTKEERARILGEQLVYTSGVAAACLMQPLCRKFETWNEAPGIEVGSPEFYSRQHYTRGTKCWNGPSRSVTVSSTHFIFTMIQYLTLQLIQFVMTCGTENAILTVSEPEKCEYDLTGTSPALCLPLDSTTEGGGKREEL